jgi:hypothetical protein
MLRHEKTSRVEQQYALARVPTEYLRRAIRPVHSGTHDDRVKRSAAVRGRFVPRVADVAAERIDSKRRILDSNRPAGRDEIRERHRVSPSGAPGSPLIRHQVMVAAITTPARNLRTSLSQRVAMPQKSPGRQNNAFDMIEAQGDRHCFKLLLQGGMHIGPLMRATYSGGNNVNVNRFTRDGYLTSWQRLFA